MKKYHASVLVKEVLEGLKLTAPLHFQALYIDATLGTAGHALEMIRQKACVLGIEADNEMLEIAGERLKDSLQPADNCFKLAHGNFADLKQIAQSHGFSQVDGILFDLGVSNLQLTSDNRGFSFANREAPLDMRLDPGFQGVTAADLLNALRPDQLRGMFGRVLEFKAAKQLAKQVAQQREIKPFKTVGDFLEVAGHVRGKPGLNLATLPFLALRIAVNFELENLKKALPQALELLKPGGRLVVISFHSGEDSLVKNFFREAQNSGAAKVLTKSPVRPQKMEILTNPRARSAKMRVLEKL